MEHVKILKRQGHRASGGTEKSLVDRATGAFYTHELIGSQLATAIVRHIRKTTAPLRLIDPFCGDGRLICWLLPLLSSQGTRLAARLVIDLWDCDEQAVVLAHARVSEVVAKLRLKADIRMVSGDSFQLAPASFGSYHIVVTNPPWEVLKPDRRELSQLAPEAKEHYVREMREQDSRLRRLYPLSQPERKFSGWGTNLARCGTEAALRLTAADGVCGLVSPASLLADQMSTALRRWILTEFTLEDLAYFPAEARLFERVDQPSITLVATPGGSRSQEPQLSAYDRERRVASSGPLVLNLSTLESNQYVIRVGLSDLAQALLDSWADLPTFATLEGDDPDQLWAGRELDETGHEKFLSGQGQYLFAKGRMIRRFGIVEQPARYVKPDGPRIPRSADYHRIAWRDVSRPTQKRRIHATLIPPGWVTGNSLNVAHYRDDDPTRLKALLGVINSLVFEFQVRANLATAHVSLGAVRKARVPVLGEALTRELAALVDHALAGADGLHAGLEVRVARMYGLTRDQYELTLKSFGRLEPGEIEALLSPERWGAVAGGAGGAPGEHTGTAMTTTKIANHFTPRLSDLDLRMVRAVPPGGNWRDIPRSIPSQRLEQIRVSYANGEGSRSTYYGRLSPDAPSYTISTYFNRPGNGCHIHYDVDGGQHRVLSQREAARLQSFPDRFVFIGNRGAVNKQIGNAVPPLLAFQLATQVAASLGGPGQFVDLFAGAGGLSLGFCWAGWEHLVANDIEDVFLQTYAANIHPSVVPGDIRKPDVFDRVINAATAGRSSQRRLFVIGGPPCQGFSTAGNRRSMEDERNLLFEKYARVLAALKPDGYLFENVAGILSMEKGEVFRMIRQQFASQGYTTAVWTLGAEEYGVPQRRTRVFILGLRPGLPACLPPEPVTAMPKGGSLFDVAPAVTVRQALEDLPPLSPGEDGSEKDYLSPPRHPYQLFMRGELTPAQLLERLERG